MFSAFNTVYGALQSFLGKSFWFANFLPVALFTFLHAVVALVVIGPITLWGSTVSFTAIDLAAVGPGIILAIIVVAYLLAPLIPLVGGLLDGSQLPAMVHDYLRGRRLADAYEIKSAINTCREDAGTLRVMDIDAHDTAGWLVAAYYAVTNPTTAADHHDAANWLSAAYEAAATQQDAREWMAAAYEAASLGIAGKDDSADWLSAAYEAAETPEVSVTQADAAGWLVAAYEAAPNPPTAADEKVLRDAVQELTRLNAALFVPGALASRAEAAQKAVVALLNVNCPDEGMVPSQDKERARQTNKVVDQFEDLLTKAVTEADYRLEIIQKRNRILGALENPMATAIGDARSVTQGYSKETYGVDFDFLWPRLLASIKAAKEKDPLLDAIDSARSTVDFAIMSLMLSVSLPLWLIVIAYQGGGGVGVPGHRGRHTVRRRLLLRTGL